MKCKHAGCPHNGNNNGYCSNHTGEQTVDMTLYSLRDVKSGYYMNMLILRNDVEAQRFFIAILEDGKSPIARHPKDYAIYSMGTINTNVGLIVPARIPQDVTPHSAVDQYMSEKEK